ncbi:AMP-binding protein [Pannonibacter tanglangensis]|uniref:AMP-binding protein n=1 Tax=Pannonibacter tanglangensis TaxID=2750084 RepID=A0ABW9ZK01_9HYPH|nr:AMP-binding protein [Pannonibacter sp. XCT-34]NBN63362.1 AMP-binding protein [Pannonibacter sp. XCT-34]
MNVAHWLARTARVMGDRPALMQGMRVLADYAELARRVRRRAAQFKTVDGLAAGDRVALFLPNCPAYLELLHAAWHAGLAVVPVNHKLHPREAAFIARDSGAALMVVEAAADRAALSAALAEAGSPARLVKPDHGLDGPAGAADPADPVARAAEDLAWLFYTSGTTGRPKGVMITHGNLMAMTLAYFCDVDEVRTEDAALYAAPMSHGAGLYNFMHVLRGAAHMVPESGGFDPAEILALGRAHGSLHLFAAPTMVRRLVDRARADGVTGEGLRTIVYGGGPMYLADIEEAVAVMGPRFVQIYGQGECPMTITALPRHLVADRSHPDWRSRLQSVGRAHACVEVRVERPDGVAAAPGEPGEILVRGAPVMAGYWGNPAATAASLRDGWLRTGDVGHLSQDGFLTLTDRSKDVIISGGSNIYPREVEEVLLTHPGVREVSVIGAADADWGEVVVAFVVADPVVDAGALDRLCLDALARFKRPKTYHFVAELPKNAYGKVLKTELRARLAAAGRP